MSEAASSPVIVARGLTKRYDAVTAVDRLDLTVGKGEVFGLLGPNGAGKTTAILMILGLTEPTSGWITTAGFDPLREPLQVKRRVGYLPDAVGFYDHMTGRDNLRFTARLAALPRGELEQRIAEALDRVHLSEAADRNVRTYSRGMRQRLGIAEILMRKVEVAILDEPTSGLDPQTTREFLDLIRSLKGEGLTVVISSHLLDLVQSICDRVALFSNGRVGLAGHVDDLMRDVLGGTYVIDLEAAGDGIAERLQALADVRRVTVVAPGHYRVDATGDIRAGVARTVVHAGADLRSLSIARASLEDVYTHYYQEVDRAA
jgi:ABC-2 type transport system ATP-binding protein